MYTEQELKDIKHKKESNIDKLRTHSTTVLPFFLSNANKLKRLLKNKTDQARADYVWLGHLNLEKNHLDFIKEYGNYVAPAGAFGFYNYNLEANYFLGLFCAITHDFDQLWSLTAYVAAHPAWFIVQTFSLTSTKVFQFLKLFFN